MAKKKKKTTRPVKKTQKKIAVQSRTKEKLRWEDLQRDWGQADSSIEQLRSTWDENEQIFLNLEEGELAEQTAKSKVNDAHLSTAIIQRTQRIMAQPPSGKVQALDTKKDMGKSLLMDYIVRYYIEKNAKSQYSFLTKLKMWVIYSQIYGSMPVLVDYVVSDQYTGPDFWLIPIRQWYPQPGVYQINDMDYCYVDSFVSREWLEHRPKSTWKNIDVIIRQLKEKSGKSKNTYPYRSYIQQSWGGDDYGGKGRFAQILLRTRYERDRWITYAPDFPDAGVLRDIPNPHENDQLPIIVKETIPLLDRYVGWGDVERGAPMQKATNSLINLYLDSVKYSLFPPTIVNREGVIPSSLRWSPGAFWFETIPNSIRQFQISPTGQATFNNAFGVLISMLNNMLGTTDLSTLRSVEPTMGKTPQALKMQAIRESAADSWERQALEEALEQLYDRMIDIMATKQEKPIDLQLFAGEIEKIQAIYPDIAEIYESGRFGKITIKPEAIKGKYKFFIDSGSTVAKDTALENQALTGVLTILVKTPVFLQAMREKGKDIDLAELVRRWIITSGIQNADEIIKDFKPEQTMAQQQPAVAGEGGQPVQQPTIDLSQIQDPMIRQAAEQLFGQQGGAAYGGRTEE